MSIVEIATSRARSVDEVARLHFYLGEELRLGLLLEQIIALPRNDRWQTMARAALRDDLHSAHAALAAEVLESGPDGATPEQRLSEWQERGASVIARAEATVDEVAASDVSDLRCCPWPCAHPDAAPLPYAKLTGGRLSDVGVGASASRARMPSDTEVLDVTNQLEGPCRSSLEVPRWPGRWGWARALRSTPGRTSSCSARATRGPRSPRCARVPGSATLSLRLRQMWPEPPKRSNQARRSSSTRSASPSSRPSRTSGKRSRHRGVVAERARDGRERVVYVFDPLSPEYLKGYRDGVSSLVATALGETPGAGPGGAGITAVDETRATWGLQAVRALESSFSGAGIRVCVLDTGVDSAHPDLADRIAKTESFIVGELEDGHGHGTHCIAPRSDRRIRGHCRGTAWRTTPRSSRARC